MADLGERLNKLYASAVYDVMRAMGHAPMVLPPSIVALNPGDRIAGAAYTINGHYEEGQDPHQTLLAWATVLSRCPPNAVLVCQPNNDEIALMGELSATALMVKGVKGYIADGGCRDTDLLLEMGFPVFARFNTPKDIAGRWIAASMGEPIVIGGITINTADYVLADRDGIVIIPQAIAEDVVAETEAVAATESEMRRAIAAGMDPVAAFNKFGKF